MHRLIFVSSVFALLTVIQGCTMSTSDTDRIAEIEKKLDRITALLDGTAKSQPALPSSAEPGDFSHGNGSQRPSTVDTSNLKRENTSDLAWLLITNDPKEKTTLVTRRLQQTTGHKTVSVENAQAVVADIEGLNVILNAPEGLDAAIVQQVEEARNRLVELLRKEIPRIVSELDKKALATADYTEARRLWSQSSAVLGFYPSSNDPAEAGRIQEMVSSHDLVRTRTELAQQQRYNLWACQQIHKAWQDFEAQSDPGARMSTCIHFLGPIHAGLLDPVTLELYRDFLQTIRGKLSRELYQDLSEKLAIEKRRVLSDFQETK
jgi:hypothetical protein